MWKFIVLEILKKSVNIILVFKNGFPKVNFNEEKNGLQNQPMD